MKTHLPTATVHRFCKARRLQKFFSAATALVVCSLAAGSAITGSSFTGSPFTPRAAGLDDSVVLETNLGDPSTDNIIFTDTNDAPSTLTLKPKLSDPRALSITGHYELITAIVRNGGNIVIAGDSTGATAGTLGTLFSTYENSEPTGIETIVQHQHGNITINLTATDTLASGYTIENHNYAFGTTTDVFGGYGISASTEQANNDTEISITSALKIFTTGTGISAKNTGAGSTGSIALTNTGTIAAFGSALWAEINSPSGSTSGSITINNSGNLSSSIDPSIVANPYNITDRRNAIAIYARIGNDENNASLQSTGAITITNTGNISNAFISIYANGDGKGGNVTIENSGTLVGLSDYGAGIFAYMDPALNPTSDRNITIRNNAGGTITSGSFGIIAQNANTDAKITVTNNAAITSNSTAIIGTFRYSDYTLPDSFSSNTASAYSGRGSVSITNTGKITVEPQSQTNYYLYGIYANNGFNATAGSANADITIGNSGQIDITGTVTNEGAAIAAAAGINSDITITNNATGTINANGVNGIYVKTYSWTTTENNINITNAAPINVTGGNHGIVVESPASAGAVTINSNGALTKTNGNFTGLGIYVKLNDSTYGVTNSDGRLAEINVNAPITNFDTGIYLGSDAISTAPDTFTITVNNNITATTGITKDTTDANIGGANLNITVAANKSITSTTTAINFGIASASTVPLKTVSIQNAGTISSTSGNNSTILLNAIENITIENTAAGTITHTAAGINSNTNIYAAVYAKTKGEINIINAGTISVSSPTTDFAYPTFYGIVGIYAEAEKKITITNSGKVPSIYAQSTSVSGSDNSISITNKKDARILQTDANVATTGIIANALGGAGTISISNEGIASNLFGYSTSTGGITIENTNTGAVRGGGGSTYTVGAGISAGAYNETGAGIKITNKGTVNTQNYSDYYVGIKAIVSGDNYSNTPTYKNIEITNSSTVYSMGVAGISATADAQFLYGYETVTSSISITNAAGGSIISQKSNHWLASWDTPFAIEATHHYRGTVNITNDGSIASEYGGILANSAYADIKLKNSAPLTNLTAGIVTAAGEGTISITNTGKIEALKTTSTSFYPLDNSSPVITGAGIIAIGIPTSDMTAGSRPNVVIYNTGDITATAAPIALLNVNTGTLYNSGKLTLQQSGAVTPSAPITTQAALFIDARNVTITLAGGTAGMITGDVIFSTSSSGVEHGPNNSLLRLGTYSQTIIGNLVFTENNKALFRADDLDPSQVQTLHVNGNVTLAGVTILFDDTALRGISVPVGTVFDLIAIEGIDTNTVSDLIKGISGETGADLTTPVPLAEGDLYRSTAGGIYSVTYHEDTTHSTNRGVALRLLAAPPRPNTPEPSTYALAGTALLAGILLLRRRRRQ